MGNLLKPVAQPDCCVTRCSESSCTSMYTAVPALRAPCTRAAHDGFKRFPMFANRNSLPTLPRHSRGMSLIEVIIVIVLIGAVLTFLTSRVLGGADRAKVNLANSQVQSLAGKIEQYDLAHKIGRA